MPEGFPTVLPPLPLLLWDVPPGLAMVLAQEGVPTVAVRDPHPLAFGVGRFVLYDGRRVPAARVRAALSPGHVALNVDVLRRDFAFDPFAALLETRPGRVRWRVGPYELTERAARHRRGEIRRRLVGRLREAVARAGGVWARLSPYPFPYRSAFNFRADLDEPVAEDYARFARARRPLDDCTTHFVSTHAYGGAPAVLGDLAGRDAQSHGHFHHVYRDPAANRRNVGRAHALLTRAGLEPRGFAGPGGRWNVGLDAALEALGYEYSSDFQVGYDDLPFFPWRGDRASRVLQVPIHPICEGLFFEAGAADARPVAEHLVRVVRAKVAAGEPAFVYGHPERRLGRHPEVLAALAGEVAGHSLLWRVTLTEFAAWWRRRAAHRWALTPKGPGRYEVQFDDWDGRDRLGLEVVRGAHVAVVPVTGPRMALRLDDLAYERRDVRADLPEPSAVRGPIGLKAAVRAALDWETVTPVADLGADSLAARLKRGLRRWKGGR